MTLETTKFAPAARSTSAQLTADYDLVVRQAVLIRFLSAVSSLVAVLNPERQIVYASEDFLHFRGLTEVAPILGSRPGEAFFCVHSHDEAAGCGTSESCSVCGAVQAFLASRSQKTKISRECRLTVQSPAGAGTLDLDVTATPWELEGREFTVITLQDIGAEKRKRSLERIFFHDIVNTIGGLNGALDLLSDYPDLNEGKDLIDLSYRSSQDILDEVLSFRELRLAEAGELEVHHAEMDAAVVIEEVAEKMRYHSVAHAKMITTVPPLSPLLIQSDRLLVERVLVNMVKNALEATVAGGTVTVGCRLQSEQIVFWVHNRALIPREVQLQIFQRSFSTKAMDRGLGTYSMRLLGETYLKGRVGFTTSKAGTEFTLTLPLA